MNKKVEGAELRSIKMTAKEFAKTHRTDLDWVLAMGDRQIEALVPGQRGVYGGETAIVERHYRNGMYEVGVPGGSVCVDGTHFVASPLPERPVASDRERLHAKLMLTAASEAPNPESVSISSDPGGLWDNPIPLEQLKALQAAKFWDTGTDPHGGLSKGLLRKLPFTEAVLHACSSGFDLLTLPIAVSWPYHGSPSPSNDFWDAESSAELSVVEGSDLQALSREELRLAIAIATFQHDAQTFKYKFDEVPPGFFCARSANGKRFFDVSIYSDEFYPGRPGIAVETSRVSGPAKAVELSINEGRGDQGYREFCEQLAGAYGLPEGSWREVLKVLCDAPSYQEPSTSALSQLTALERACEQPSLERPKSIADNEDSSTRMT